jgi:hypothetical protein
MDAQRFDGFSRALAGRISRRTALRRGGQTGIAAALVAGVTRQTAAAAPQHTQAAQELSDLLDDTCLRLFEVSVRQGPNEGQEYLGVLALRVADGGAIEEGYFATSDGDDFPIVGQATGRSIGLLITLAEGQTVYGVGVGEHEVGACAGQMGGPLVGPEPGDMGDWAVIDLANQTPGTRSRVCKGCLQSCRICFGFGCVEPPEPGVCRDACMQFGSCNADDFV